MVEKKRVKEEEGRGVARTLVSRVFLLPFIRFELLLSTFWAIVHLSSFFGEDYETFISQALTNHSC